MAASKVTPSCSPSQFSTDLLETYKSITNVYAAGMGLAPVFPKLELRLELQQVPFHPQRNYEIRCDALVDVDAGGKGNGHECGKPTQRCPGCGEWSGNCEEHLAEQPDGTRVCWNQCDGSPQFSGEHTKDSDCTLDDHNTCIICGVYHGGPCETCKGRGYHVEGCPDAERLNGAVVLEVA